MRTFPAPRDRRPDSPPTSRTSKPRRGPIVPLMLAALALTLFAEITPASAHGFDWLRLQAERLARGESAAEPQAPTAEVVQRRRAERARRHAILDLVRRHRPAADETWRRRLADAVYAEAKAAGVDPLMVASIVARESSFQTRVVSPAGAVGLMQLRPWVAQDLAERRGIAWAGADSLYQPDVNVRLGILYYKELMDRFGGDETTALAAYNAGPTRISRQIRAGAFEGSAYAERILHLYDGLQRAHATVTNLADTAALEG